MNFFITSISLIFYAVFAGICFYLIRTTLRAQGKARLLACTPKPIAVPASAKAPTHPTPQTLRGDLMLRMIHAPHAIDDMAGEILISHPRSMVMRHPSIYEGPFPTYAVAIPDAGMCFDIQLIHFDPRNALASVEQAILRATLSDGSAAAVPRPSTRQRL